MQISRSRSLLLPRLLRLYSGSPLSGDRTRRRIRRAEEQQEEDAFLRTLSFGDDGNNNKSQFGRQGNPPPPPPPEDGRTHRPLRATPDCRGDGKAIFPAHTFGKAAKEQESDLYWGGKRSSQGDEQEREQDGDQGLGCLQPNQESRETAVGGGRGGSGGIGESLLQKLNLGDASGGPHGNDNGEEAPAVAAAEPEREPEPEPPQDAGEIFRKMKETGLIPNAVAMLDGLCKDGLVQEAMKLFGLMREKGTIPDVVVYTAVVEAFCQAARFDDAKRIFRKMQNNGIIPNAFSYGVLIQGLCKGGKLDDGVQFCVEMFEAGHSLNAATFVGLVDGLCKGKGAEEAEMLVKSFQDRNFAIDEKSIREHLDKKGPFSRVVWEAIFGKKKSNRTF